MTETRDGSQDVELLAARRVRLVEGRPPELPAEHRRAMDRAWDEAVTANPALFDGPIVVLTGIRLEADLLALTWARATFRYGALHRVPGAAPLPGVYASVVQPATEGGFLVGRMAAWTSVPSRWLLPGGTVEPPPPGEAMDLATLRGHAARELREETGIVTSPDDLTLVTVVRGISIGFLFQAPPRPVAALRAAFAEATAAETAEGRTPELDDLVLLRSSDDLADLPGHAADYLPGLLRLFGTP
ncbi:ADP-ribose pyrophosphatase YjhB (NUDIX family) [Actinocorallia herbida]|uniref:ADP-ribose pyrophosphatase YjhB (NUDIX family) n=1 Tax=Actinocorallia herbida TaxID=58109 RepID=A0A3N1CYA4_9ACTN|nr:NUDIX hydrolase [Actinocorallia herbida]ROO86270.1 ADP-ribose pyrophosphatase YjhB (NUDIX family) [Actinocorallia herbida]